MELFWCCNCKDDSGHQASLDAIAWGISMQNNDEQNLSLGLVFTF